MKKIILTLVATVLSVSLIAGVPAVAVNVQDSISVLAEEISATTSNPDLYSLAYSLGADKDSFSFSDYTAESISDELLERLKEEDMIGSSDFLGEFQSGVYNGFAVLEVLNHNGVISPSDIQENAKTLRDISFDSRVNDILCYYHILQNYPLQEMVRGEYYCSHDIADQCNDLIKYGEQAVENGKYFLISLRKNDCPCSVVGIGSADGIWVYNGKKYDKCILTLDSNSSSGLFDPDRCIYINSVTNEFYIPAYMLGSDDENTFITLVTDDTDILNYMGYINPSEDVNPEYSQIKNIRFEKPMISPYDITVECDGKSETYSCTPKNDTFTKNKWGVAEKYIEAGYYKKADSLSFTLNTIEGPNSLNRGSSIGVYTEDSDRNRNYIFVPNNTTGTVNDDTFTSKNLRDEDNRYSFDTLRYKDNKYDYKFSMNGVLSDTISMKVLDEGILVSATDNNVNGVCEFIIHDTGDDEDYKAVISQFNVFAINDVMIKLNKDSGEVYFAIGENFDTPVEIGDVDCNGMINASDATFILSNYAQASTGGKNMLNTQLADFNSDGIVNAVDASQVLAEYARRSTTESDDV
ncbi:MAG: hypothetical protein K2H26_03410 [Ruminococcus sp.]|nr:hypothetical protein [Ruminococcus sp.]